MLDELLATRKRRTGLVDEVVAKVGRSRPYQVTLRVAQVAELPIDFLDQIERLADDQQRSIASGWMLAFSAISTVVAAPSEMTVKTPSSIAASSAAEF